jgi:hypothetical protein
MLGGYDGNSRARFFDNRSVGQNSEKKMMAYDEVIK